MPGKNPIPADTWRTCELQTERHQGQESNPPSVRRQCSPLQHYSKTQAAFKLTADMCSSMANSLQVDPFFFNDIILLNSIKSISCGLSFVSKRKEEKKRGELVSLEVKHQMLSFIQTAIWMFSKDRASYYAERISKLTFINYSAIICTSVKVPLSVSSHTICPLPFRDTESPCCRTLEETPSQS